MKTSWKLLPILAATILAPQSLFAYAAETEWQELGGGKARMVATLDPDTAKISGVLQLRLKPGWKTYWRIPGEGGIPPQLDFNGSKGYVNGNITLPTPHSITLSGLEFIGYDGEIMIGFDGQKLPASTSGKVKMEAFLGLCEEICIPAQASFEMDIKKLSVSSAMTANVLELARQTYPSVSHSGFGVTSAKIEGDQLLLETHVPADTRKVEAFVEGFERWRTPPARLKNHSGKKAVFSMNIANVPLDERIGRALTVTLSADGSGVESYVKTN